jgi:hypothetical protein
MPTFSAKPIEHKCPACKGTGFPPVAAGSTWPPNLSGAMRAMRRQRMGNGSQLRAAIELVRWQLFSQSLELRHRRDGYARRRIGATLEAFPIPLGSVDILPNAPSSAAFGRPPTVPTAVDPECPIAAESPPPRANEAAEVAKTRNNAMANFVVVFDMGSSVHTRPPNVKLTCRSAIHRHH